MAALEEPFLHPGGPEATEAWLRAVPLHASMRILDLGCGTGATAVWVVQRTGARVVALDRSWAMLRGTQRRSQAGGCADRIHPVQADLEAGLPFRDRVFDGVYAESVLALVHAAPVLAECARVVRPGGFLVLIERIWKPNTPLETVSRINALSCRLFGTPAAVDPLDRTGWCRALEVAGFAVQAVYPVSFSPVSPLESRRWSRWRRYLRRPHLLVQALRFRCAIYRHRTLFTPMESYLFIGQRTEQSTGGGD